MDELASLAHCKLETVSSLYGSSPMGPQDQPDYVNAVAALRTRLSPFDLLVQLQDLEQRHGRRRDGQRWTARTLDLDILLYGDQIINTENLCIPHPGLGQRNFVLYPLQEISPGLQVPGLGPLAGLIAGCAKGDLVKLREVGDASDQ